ncbi:fatty acyl-AMP ligase [Actinophytocola algeriensis]|uniref:Fatty-acyl-CoA synthase n=1 Tax=Actinophytocola algeriensis TaxID=1768010 RepID=A0A7W7VI93_9PSEU|nr:fatty acyl-AMP ligase [Actinophytocola algeriensis]MBB4911203.1 fatty-acyl-CoA synthase [Actinophytocola algeriensis]MBE1479142.1 fatty-acyl-CoA synthase [Actinophytocola algeriensis]
MSRFVDKLVATAGAGGQRRGVTTGEPGEPVHTTWAQVHEQAKAMAGALVSHGLARGDAVAVLAAAPAAIGPAVQAVWLAGGSVTMLHQPTPRSDLAMWAEDTVRVLNMIGSKLVLLGDPFDQLAPVLEQHGIGYLLISELGGGTPLATFVEVDEDAPALLQLTSGSTADPKAVRITHGNLLANITAMADRAELDPEHDVMVSWLPMFHDMGMVGFYTTPMAWGIELVKVTPVDFLTAPLLWAKLITEYGGTITAAPNFAYALLGRRLGGEADDAGYDLSKLRIALNGAEPIDEKAVKAFVEAGARFKMPAECVFPAYGMAEGTLAISFASPMIGLRLDHLDAVALEEENRAVPVDASVDESARRTFAILGPPLDGFDARIVSVASGAAVSEREVGEIQVRGPSVTPGYLTVDGPLATMNDEGWLPTGDLGYIVDGEIVICGRAKDVIILAGRNIYPTDIERAATSVDGVRAGNAVAVRLDAGTRRERFAVVVESRFAGDAEKAKSLRKEVGARVFEAVNARPSAVLVLPAGTLPKTPSGKLRRAAAGEQLAESIKAAS